MKNIDFIYEGKHSIKFNSNQLKLVAMITMLIDHIGLMLILNGKLYGYDLSLYSYVSVLNSAHTWRVLYRICRMVGRISFPIFTFCVVEGFLRTSNIFKYIIRVFVFALLSEIPFDLMVTNSFSSFEYQNVLWTYFIGLLLLCIIDLIRKMKWYKWIKYVIQALFVALAIFIVIKLKTDYDYRGIILMCFYYLTCLDRNLRSLGSAILSFIISVGADYGFGILSTFFIHFYNGKKGSLNLKWLFYWFYPLHMLLLYLIVYFSYIGK